MKFHITGANKTDGSDIEITVVAVDRKHAEHIAQERGIMVSDVKALPPEFDLSTISLEEESTAGAAPAEGSVDPAVKAAMAARAAAALMAQPAAPDPSQPVAADANHAAVEDHGIHHTGVSQYRALINPNLMLLVISVNSALKQGWQLQGGVSTCVINNAVNYLQALVHHPEK